MEIWKPVVGYKGLYEVSNLGRVKGISGKILRPVVRNHGYLAVYLYGKENRKIASVHRIVAEAFLDNPNEYTEVNHKDENKANNEVSNLEWCNHRYNTNYGTTQARRAAKMINGPKAKAVDQLAMDGTYIRTFPSMAEVKRVLVFDQANIFSAINGKYTQAYGYKWRYSTEV